ncbi:MAG: asparagine synthetase B, partial [Gammaproteobacteria bacterium]
MCGIAGIWRAAPGAELLQVARDMASAIAHRGPDGAGAWVDDAGGPALAHRRLSIIDLSAAGAQPMAARSGRCVVVFNGEIYNHLALRRELERDGVGFVGHSDTEVLVEACNAWGLAATLARVEGMFALALWDRATRRLALARDRFGEKPLYYGWHRGAFVFASELKALHAWPEFRPRLDRGALALYLRHNYVPDPHCIYQGLRKLVPGSWIEVTLDEHAALPTPRVYWSLAQTLAPARAAPFAGDATAATDAVEARLRDAVSLRTMADVPLGAFLSGG